MPLYAIYWFQKTYNSSHREFLIGILIEFKISQKIIGFIKIIIERTDIKMKIGRSTLNVVYVTTRLRYFVQYSVRKVLS